MFIYYEKICSKILVIASKKASIRKCCKVDPGTIDRDRESLNNGKTDTLRVKETQMEEKWEKLFFQE